MNINNFQIVNYFPGSIGRITQLHALYYSRHWNFNLKFEAWVGRELSEFLLRFDSSRDFFKVAVSGEIIIGSIAIDGQEYETEGARLRWFITDEEFQGIGVGKALLSESLSFSRVAGPMFLRGVLMMRRKAASSSGFASRRK